MIGRVVCVNAVFPFDVGLYRELALRCDLVLYGSTARAPYRNIRPPRPEGLATREFRALRPSRRRRVLTALPGLGAALTRDHPDVLHVIAEPWSALAVQATRWARRHPETIFVLHGCDRIWWHGSDAEQSLRKRLTGYSLERADAFAAETPKAIDLAFGAGLRTGAPTAILHTNPRDPDVFTPAGAAERTAARTRLGLPVDGVGVGFLGRLVPEKGSLLLVEAFSAAIDRLPKDTWLTVAGAGPLEDRVRGRLGSTRGFFLGHLPYPEGAQDFYRAVDVVVVPSITTPSWDDQSPRVVIEAMMSGCTIVGSTCGAIPDMLGQGGATFAEGDPSALADTLVRVARRAPTQRERELIRSRAVAAYATTGTAKRMLALWQRAGYEGSGGAGSEAGLA